VLLVDYRWFILPAVLYGIVAVFFVATIITTRRDTPIWKSSPLPLLHATGEEGSVETVRGFQVDNKESRMRLGRTARGWRLVEERALLLKKEGFEERERHAGSGSTEQPRTSRVEVRSSAT